jgi:hypothetical protein
VENLDKVTRIPCNVDQDDIEYVLPKVIRPGVLVKFGTEPDIMDKYGFVAEITLKVVGSGDFGPDAAYRYPLVDYAAVYVIREVDDEGEQTGHTHENVHFTQVDTL